METRSTASNSAVPLPRRSTLRGPLLALLVFAGLFAMHGLTTEHNASMATAGSPMTMSAASHVSDEMPGMAASTITTAAHAAHAVAGAATAAASDHAMSEMGALCVALLTGLLLLIAVRRLLSPSAATDADPARAAARRWRATAYTRPPPDLAALSVLRT